MSIRLYMDKDGVERADAKNVCVRSLSNGAMILVDTCILFPALLPRERRNLTNVEELSSMLDADRFSNTNKGIRFMRAYTKKMAKKRIEIVNAIEDGRFYDKGVYVGITSQVYGELQAFDRLCERHENYSVDDYWEGIKGSYACMINNSLDRFNREESYKPILKMFGGAGDKSIALVSNIMGCDIATDDHKAFNDGYVKKRLKELYLEKWGLERSLNLHDSDSLLMLLSS